jgi:hypothetical protein
MRFALIKDNLVVNSIDADQQFADGISGDWQAVVNTTEMSPPPGIGWTYINGVFTAPPIPPDWYGWVITRNAFQNRFPMTANGVSTKYDLMTLFLTDRAYAESLGVTGSAIFELRSILITGNNRLGAVSSVDLQAQETINYVNMTTNVVFPDAFRLTAAEANAILTTPAASNET